MLIGYAGRSIEEVYTTSLLEFEAVGMAQQEQSRERWEIARWLSFNQMSMSPFIKQKPTSARAFCRFPWEKGEIVQSTTLTEEEQAELFRLIDFHNERIKN